MIMKRIILVSFCLALFLFAGFLASKPNSEQEEKLGEDDALAAFEYWYGQRAAPYEQIPVGAFMRAAEHSRRMPHERDLTTALADTTQWTSLGPNNVGGRTLAVAINPSNTNIIWAGAASGGLWKSTTAGAGANAWTYVNTGYPTVAVSSIAIDPLNNNIMYIGTGEVGSAYGRGQVGTPGARATYGMGVLKSTDGGNTWALTELSADFYQLTAVQKVLLNPANPNTVYAITSEGTFKSTDAGSTWLFVHDVLMGMDIVINPSDTTILYASYGQRNSTFGKGLYKTTNAGASWTRLTSLDTTNFGRTSLAISPSNPQVVYASVAHGNTSQLRGLYRTTNAGTTWTLQSTTNYVSSQGWYDNVIAVHPTNPDFVFGNGLDIYKSTNGGTTLIRKSVWSAGYDGTIPAGGPEGPANYAHADHHSITFHPTNPNIVYFGCDGGIFVSTDAGETFDGRNGGYQTIQIYNGFATAETTPNVALAGLQDNGTLKYEGTLSWNKTFGGDGGWCSIDPTNENILYEEYVYLAMSKSTDGGNSWFGITSGLATGSSNANFIAPFAISPSNPNILYAGAKVVYKTTNGGNSWSATNGGLIFNGTNVACIGVSYRNPDTLIAGTGVLGGTFQIFRTTDGGTGWTNVTGALPGRYPTDISFDPNTSLIAYLTYSGFGTSHVFKTTDAGLTWADISTNLPDIPTQSVVVDPLLPGHLYVGTDLGVYRSTNGGASWVVFDTGMPPAMVLDLAISNVNRSLRAATFGNGVYERELTAPGVFDNRALSLSSPSNGTEILVNSTVSPISAVYKSVGGLTSPDSFDVKYRILNGLTEVYSNTKHIAALGAGESRSITFDGSFTPSSVGDYTLQAICIASDQNASNDTLTGTLNVVAEGTIASLNVIKVYSPYTEITGGTAGPSGDDAQSSLVLPFAFTFDGVTYDKLQLSTNGWVEFGTGADGTTYGLSTSGQIGLGNQNGLLFSTGRPTKCLGPWLEDLSTATTGTVSYITLGSSPNRVFVVQWKNVLAYYDETSTTTRINFQVRLNEGTNIVEFNYGPVVAGTFAGDGAMLGMKDHIGGNFHFYDMTLGGSGTTGQGNTSLTPLANWPGADSSYVIGNDLTTSTVGILEQWNLISVPLTRTNNQVQAIYTSSLTGTTYRFAGGAYQLRDSLAPGSGYWTKFPVAANAIVWGNPLSAIVVPVSTGWNLIGSVDHPVTGPTGGIIESAYFEYSSSGYSTVTTLQPGRGYWVKTNSAGSITLGPAPARQEPHIDPEKFNNITIRDAAGKKQTLWFTERSPELNLNRFEAPPSPPVGALNIRFSSNRLVEGFRSEESQGETFPIMVEGAQLPAQLSCNIKSADGKRFFIEEVRGNRVVSSREIGDGVSVTVLNEQGASLVLKVVGGTELPKEFTLKQNYPNPFNPTTRIEYTLPVDSKVQLSVFDITGKEITTLLNVEQPAGYLSVEWDGKNNLGAQVGSGVYLYRITAITASGKEFTEARKMLLVK